MQIFIDDKICKVISLIMDSFGVNLCVFFFEEQYKILWKKVRILLLQMNAANDHPISKNRIST